MVRLMELPALSLRSRRVWPADGIVLAVLPRPTLMDAAFLIVMEQW